jgi:osomolarity two-component system sensor histidine kinase NIK1
MTIENITFSIRHLVFQALKGLSVRAQQGQVDLTYDVDNHIPDQIVGDMFRLRQVSRAAATFSRRPLSR